MTAMIPETGCKPSYWDRAVCDLKFNDRMMSQIIGRYGDNEFLMSRGEPFVTLVRSIVGQQISVKAADAVWKRLLAEVCAVRPESILKAGLAVLRRSGLSGRKADYVLHLAGSFQREDWTDRFHSCGDEEVIDALVTLPGIGRWTAEMFLMFCLLRPNVLPLDDIGLLRAMSGIYHEGNRVTREEASAIGRRWQPWRTVATWFMWRSLDPVPVSY